MLKKVFPKKTFTSHFHVPASVLLSEKLLNQLHRSHPPIHLLTQCRELTLEATERSPESAAVSCLRAYARAATTWVRAAFRAPRCGPGKTIRISSCPASSVQTESNYWVNFCQCLSGHLLGTHHLLSSTGQVPWRFHGMKRVVGQLSAVVFSSARGKLFNLSHRIFLLFATLFTCFHFGHFDFMNCRDVWHKCYCISSIHTYTISEFWNNQLPHTKDTFKTHMLLKTCVGNAAFPYYLFLTHFCLQRSHLTAIK